MIFLLWIDSQFKAKALDSFKASLWTLKLRFDSFKASLWTPSKLRFGLPKKLKASLWTPPPKLKLSLDSKKLKASLWTPPHLQS